MKLISAFVLAFACFSSLAYAGPGHDHGDGGASVQASADIPRLSSVTADLELVATAEGHKLTVYLDNPATNEPIDGATIEVTADGKGKAMAKPVGPGVYEVDADWVDTPGVKALVFTVTTPKIADLLNGTLDIHGPEPAAAAPPLDFKALMGRVELWVWSAITAALGFFLSFAFRPMRAPDDDPAAAALRIEPNVAGSIRQAAALLIVMAAGLALVSNPSWAGPGHDHGGGESAAPTGGNVPRRQADGSVFMPKPAQRLLRIRTLETSATTAPRAVELLGTVVSDPAASGRVQAPFAGRIELTNAGIAFVGQRVKQGDVLAGLVPTVSSVERGSVQQQLAEIDGNIAQAEQKVSRLGKLVGSVPQAEIDQARAELTALRERRKALSPSLFGQEQLRAPVSGIIASALTARCPLVSSAPGVADVPLAFRFLQPLGRLDPERLGPALRLDHLGVFLLPDDGFVGPGVECRIGKLRVKFPAHPVERGEPFLAFADLGPEPEEDVARGAGGPVLRPFGGLLRLLAGQKLAPVGLQVAGVGRDRAALHQPEPVCDEAEQVHVVGDEDHRAGIFGQRLHQRLAGLDVEVVGGLVEDQKMRRVDGGEHQRQPRLLPAGELRHHRLRLVGHQPESREPGAKPACLHPHHRIRPRIEIAGPIAHLRADGVFLQPFAPTRQPLLDDVAQEAPEALRRGEGGRGQHHLEGSLHLGRGDLCCAGWSGLVRRGGIGPVGSHGNPCPGALPSVHRAPAPSAIGRGAHYPKASGDTVGLAGTLP